MQLADILAIAIITNLVIQSKITPILSCATLLDQSSMNYLYSGRTTYMDMQHEHRHRHTVQHRHGHAA